MHYFYAYISFDKSGQQISYGWGHCQSDISEGATFMNHMKDAILIEAKSSNPRIDDISFTAIIPQPQFKS